VPQLKWDSLAAKPREPENGYMDINTLAKSIVDQATGEATIVQPREKSPKAVAMTLQTALGEE
jgi:hypothetical protein